MSGAQKAYAALLEWLQETEALAQIAERQGWDQEAMMPAGASRQRAEEVGALERVLHRRRSDPRLGDWLDLVDADSLDAAGRANLRLTRRSWGRACKVPAELAGELAKTTSLAQGCWAQARAAEDSTGFLPALAEVVALKRQEAQALATDADVSNEYDALLDEYEPGARADGLARLFAELTPPLLALRDRILGKHAPQQLKGYFPSDAQIRIARDLARRFGYDFNRGRLDEVTHPFCAGSGSDVRITTRIDTADPFNCLYSTIHEVGHAVYEQSIDDALALTPAGHGASIGIHESQSRICENQLGRSPAFTRWLFERMRSEFGELSCADAGEFGLVVNAVRPGFIRTEADEVQYNLHAMVRFDLERQLIAGTLAVHDLETAWNELFQERFGRQVDRPSNGFLQDVHWAVGYFGYFPTYVLGNVYAGCLHEALRADLPNLDLDLAAGNPLPAMQWLKTRLQRHGATLEPAEALQQACGRAMSAQPLITYLNNKFAALYQL